MNEKYTLMKTEKAVFPIARMARLLKGSTSGFYSWEQAQLREDDEEKQLPRVRARRDLDRRVRRIWASSSKTYGSPRVHAQLAREGVRADRETVAESMRRMGMEGNQPPPVPPRDDLAWHVHALDPRPVQEDVGSR